MKIAILVKQVPDTATQIQIKPDNSGIVPEGVKYILGPYDEFAVEEGLKLKEKLGDAEVIAVTVGPPRSVEMLRTCLAMGVDKAVRIWGDGLPELDAYATARLLAKYLEEVKPDLIWSGRQGVDDDMAYVGAAVAELLGYPFVSMAHKFAFLQAENRVRVVREAESGGEVLEVSLPCALSAQKGLNEPRYPSLAGMMKAKKKEIEEVSAGSLFPDIAALVKTEVVRLDPPQARSPGKMLSGTPQEVAKELVRLLREEAKVI